MRQPADPLRETQSPAVHASPTAVSAPRLLSIAVGAGVFLGLVGPLGTIDLPIGLRLGYWLVATLGGSLLGWAVTLLVMRWPAARAHRWLGIVAIAVVMTPPGVLMVWAWGRMAVPDVAGFGDVPTLAWSVLLISLVMTAINRLLVPEAASAQAAPAAEISPSAPASPFAARLPPRLRGATIHAVEAQDHYLRVHTDRGSDLILMRLSDALGELAALDGARTHRSWWVARAAVRGVERGDGRAVLTLEGGQQVPVSRAHAPGLRAVGWF